MPGLDLSAWQTDEEPEFTTEPFEGETAETSVTPHATSEEISEDILKEAIEKAKASMNERAKFEYESWLYGKIEDFVVVLTLSCLAFIFVFMKINENVFVQIFRWWY